MFRKKPRSCDCLTLRGMADDPDLPIRYDADLAEFYFVFPAGGSEGKLVFHYCPFCGGKTPESQRHRLFAVISSAEQARLLALTAPLKSVEEVIAALGEPDEDLPTGEQWTMPERDGKPPVIQNHRTLRYGNLSDVAVLRVRVLPEGEVSFGLHGKYLGGEMRAEE